MSDCPRCYKALEAKLEILPDGTHEDVKVCKSGDGVLLPLKGLQRKTNRRFIQHFWKYWFKLRRQKSFICPNCGSRMETLNDETDAPLVLDCCPSCFSLWLDAGEDEALQKFFTDKYQNADANAPLNQKLSAEHLQVLAKAALEHEATMRKYNAMIAIGNLFNMEVSLRSRFRNWF